MCRMRIRLAVPVVALVVGLVLVGCGGRQNPTPPPPTPTAVPAAPAVAAGDAEKGQVLYASTCAACHGAAGEGVQGLGKDMTTSQFMADLNDTEMLEFLKVGRAPDDPLNTTGVLMPPKGGNPAISDAQLMDIIAFLRTIHK